MYAVIITVIIITVNIMNAFYDKFSKIKDYYLKVNLYLLWCIINTKLHLVINLQMYILYIEKYIYILHLMMHFLVTLFEFDFGCMSVLHIFCTSIFLCVSSQI